MRVPISLLAYIGADLKLVGAIDAGTRRVQGRTKLCPVRAERNGSEGPSEALAHDQSGPRRLIAFPHDRAS